MATISWQVKPSYAAKSYQGGVIQVDDARDYNIAAHLAAGPGGNTIVEDAGDIALVRALDAQAALQRSGSTEIPPSPTKSVHEVQALLTDAPPGVEQIIVRKTDGTFEERPLSGVVVGASGLLVYARAAPGVEGGGADEHVGLQAVVDAVKGTDMVLVFEQTDDAYASSTQIVIDEPINIDVVGRPTFRQLTAHKPFWDVWAPGTRLAPNGEMYGEYLPARTTTAGTTRGNNTHKFSAFIWLGADDFRGPAHVWTKNFYAGFEASGWDPNINDWGAAPMFTDVEIGVIHHQDVSWGAAITSFDGMRIGGLKGDYMRTAGDNDPAHSLYVLKGFSRDLKLGDSSVTWSGGGTDSGGPDVAYQFKTTFDTVIDSSLECHGTPGALLFSDCRNVQITGLVCTDPIANGGNGGIFYVTDAAETGRNDNIHVAGMWDQDSGRRIARGCGTNLSVHLHTLKTNYTNLSSAMFEVTGLMAEFDIEIGDYENADFANGPTLLHALKGDHRVRVDKAVGLAKFTDLSWNGAGDTDGPATAMVEIDGRKITRSTAATGPWFVNANGSVTQFRRAEHRFVVAQTGGQVGIGDGMLRTHLVVKPQDTTTVTLTAPNSISQLQGLEVEYLVENDTGGVNNIAWHTNLSLRKAGPSQVEAGRTTTMRFRWSGTVWDEVYRSDPGSNLVQISGDFPMTNPMPGIVEFINFVNTRTATLPSGAGAVVGQPVLFRIGVNVPAGKLAIVATSGADTFEGGATTLQMDKRGQFLVLIWNGSVWEVIGASQQHYGNSLVIGDTVPAGVTSSYLQISDPDVNGQYDLLLVTP